MSVETKIDTLVEAVDGMRSELTEATGSIQVIDERTERMDREVDIRFAGVSKRIDDVRQDATSAGKRGGAGVSIPVSAAAVLLAWARGWLGIP